jgi:hypothetical protein
MPSHDATDARMVVEDLREALYALADRVPRLSQPLSAATVALTEVLAALELGHCEEAHEGLVGALNRVASAHPCAPSDAVHLELAAVRAVLGRALVTVSHSGGPRHHLSLVDPA